MVSGTPELASAMASQRVYVGNLDPQLQKEELTRAAEKYGKLDDVIAERRTLIIAAPAAVLPPSPLCIHPALT